MSALSSLLSVRSRALAALGRLSFLAPLLARTAVGPLFASTGWGKLHSLDRVTQFFTELGIPAPGAHAVLVGCTEFLGGLCLCLGLGTRLFAPALATTMVVALLTALRPDIHGFLDLVEQEEFTYLIVLLVLALVGAGPVSVDHVIATKLEDAERRART